MGVKKKILTHEAQLAEQNIKINNLFRTLQNYNQLSQPNTKDYSSLINDIDLQQYISRYKWEGLPDYIPINMIERMLYFRGGLVGFFQKGQLFILPYAIDGDLNEYGYPVSVQPVTYNGTIYPSKKLKVYPQTNASGVLLHDRASIINSGKPIARFVVADSILSYLNDIMQKGEINLINAVKKVVYRVTSEDQVSVTEKSINASLNSTSPVIVTTDDINGGDVFNSNIENETEKIMQMFSSVNNLRCMSMGVKNNGVFEKMERVVVGELSGNEYQTNLILESGLQQRQEWVERMKEIFPEYSDVLSKIKVTINVEPYMSKVDNTMENATREEGDNAKSKVGVENEN